MRDLEVPEEVAADPDAQEMIRAWVLPNDEIGFATIQNPWDDPAALGIFFADLARHFFSTSGLPPEEWDRALRRTAEGILAEAGSSLS